MTAVSAPLVSRHLKAAGFGISQTRNREGIRVSRGAVRGTVSVSVDLDLETRATRLADTLEDWLKAEATPRGWTYTRSHGTIFRIEEAEVQPSPRLKKPLPVEQSARLGRDSESGKLQGELNTATTRLRAAIYKGTTPAQADITAARTALEALIELAGGDQ